MSDNIPLPSPVPQGVPTPTPTVPPAAPVLISIDDFFKIKLATAEVVAAQAHPKADRLLILTVKIGTRTKQIVSGIREWYTPEAMLGKMVIIVDNLQPAKLRGETSEGMLLAVKLPEGGLRLLSTDGPTASGLAVS